MISGVKINYCICAYRDVMMKDTHIHFKECRGPSISLDVYAPPHVCNQTTSVQLQANMLKWNYREAEFQI